ncbi:MAG: putative secreted protein, partial [uncultured Frankineae bacterium]
ACSAARCPDAVARPSPLRPARPALEDSAAAGRRRSGRRARGRRRRARADLRLGRGLDRAVRAAGPLRERRQLGHQHRQRLLRRAAVQPGDVAWARPQRLPAPGQQGAADRRRAEAAQPAGLAAVAGLLAQAGPVRQRRLQRLRPGSAGRAGAHGGGQPRSPAGTGTRRRRRRQDRARDAGRGPGDPGRPAPHPAARHRAGLRRSGDDRPGRADVPDRRSGVAGPHGGARLGDPRRRLLRAAQLRRRPRVRPREGHPDAGAGHRGQGRVERRLDHPRHL